MSFINFPSPTPVFPALPPQAWSVHKMPTFQKTLTSVAISGREYQINRQVVPRFEFTLVYGGDSWLRDETQNINPFNPLAGYTELEQLVGLFEACLGSYGEFYYSDPDDNSRLAQLVATGDGTTTTFMLYFSWGTGPFSPPAYYPVTGINTLDAVYLNGVLQDPSSYSLDSTNTQVVFNTPPDSTVVITADFHFYYRCRFLNDMEEFDQWAKNLWEKKELKFMSVKNDGPAPPAYVHSMSGPCVVSNITIQQGDCNTILPFSISGLINPATVALGTNTGGATLSGTLTRTPVAGVATFNDLTVNLPGIITLVATSTGFGTLLSYPLTIIAAPFAICTPFLSASSISNLPASATTGLYYIWYYQDAAGFPPFLGTLALGRQGIGPHQGGITIQATGSGPELTFNDDSAIFSTIIDASSPPLTAGWHQDIISWGNDGMGGRKIQWMRDGAFLSGFGFTGANVPLTIPFDSGPFPLSLGVNSVELSDLFLWLGNSFFDLTISANVALIRTSMGKPVDNSSNPSGVTGSDPQVFFHNNYATWNANLGNGGAVAFSSPAVFSSTTPWP